MVKSSSSLPAKAIGSTNARSVLKTVLWLHTPVNIRFWFDLGSREIEWSIYTLLAGIFLPSSCG